MELAKENKSFSDKYISATDKVIDKTSIKVVISDDAFALGDVIDLLCNIILGAKFALLGSKK